MGAARQSFPGSVCHATPGGYCRINGTGGPTDPLCAGNGRAPSCCPSMDKLKGRNASGSLSRSRTAQGTGLAQDSRAGPQQGPGTMNLGQTSSRGATRGQLILPGRSPGRARGSCTLASQVPGGRIAPGEALYYHDAWRKLPVASTAPTGHLMRPDDGPVGMSGISLATGVAFAGKATRSGCQAGPASGDSQDAKEDK